MMFIATIISGFIVHFTLSHEAFRCTQNMHCSSECCLLYNRTLGMCVNMPHYGQICGLPGFDDGLFQLITDDGVGNLPAGSNVSDFSSDLPMIITSTETMNLYSKSRNFSSHINQKLRKRCCSQYGRHMEQRDLDRYQRCGSSCKDKFMYKRSETALHFYTRNVDDVDDDQNVEGVESLPFIVSQQHDGEIGADDFTVEKRQQQCNSNSRSNCRQRRAVSPDDDLVRNKRCGGGCGRYMERSVDGAGLERNARCMGQCGYKQKLMKTEKRSTSGVSVEKRCGGGCKRSESTSDQRY